jgi:5S rRNA maturation endonuclease (ribonuclease M5)
MSEHNTLISNIKRQITFPDLFKELFPDNFQERGNSHCPFHEDSAASFQVEKEHGFCHAGCKPPGGNGKRWSVVDLWMRAKGSDFKTAVSELAERYEIHEPEPKAKREPVAIYDYTDEHGTLLFQVCRFEPKDFRQRRPDGKGGWTWSLGDTRRVLYRLTAVLQADVVWICEGEKDADNLAALGLCGTTSPQGAGKWSGLVDKHRIHEPLKSKHIHILPDNDGPGRDHAQDIAKSLQGFVASVKIVELPGLEEKGDLSDFIDKHGAESRLLIEGLAARVPEYEPPKKIKFGSYSCADLMAEDIPEVKWTIPGLLTEGLTVLAGSPKIGKSWLAFAIGLAVSAGLLALSFFQCNAGRVLYLALEDNKRRLKSRLVKMGKGDSPNLGNIFIETLAPKIRESKGTQNLLDKLNTWLLENSDAALIVIDTLAKVKKSHRGNQGSYEADYADIEGLQQLAAMYSVSIVLVTHDRKEEDSDPLKTITGSTGIVGAADSAWVLTKKRGDHEGGLFITGRDIEERKGTLMFEKDSGLWRWLGDAAELKMNNLSLDIRNALREAGKPLAPKEISESLGRGTTGTQYEAVKKMVQRMAERGELDRALNHKYALPPEDMYYGNSSSYYERTPEQTEAYLDHI